MALDGTVENLLRELAPQVLGAVMRRYGDFSAAEDAVQEALIAASRQWPAEGLPDNPRGWLIQVAVRRMADHVRAELARRRREAVVVMQAPAEEEIVPAPDSDILPERDDTLVLLFMCCHPALTRPTAIALTLRAVAGLTTAEIANAFLVPESTMAQRISRAKQTIKSSGVPFEMPTSRERAERLGAVLHVVYLIFNEGYASSIGPSLQRVDLANEAIRLARALHRRIPEDAETAGMLALMHAEAPRVDDTDWPQIVALYTVLMRISDNPMVALNHAIAAAMVRGPATGLTLLDGLDVDRRIAGHYRACAVRAHLLEMSGDYAGAITHYLAAAGRTASIPERDYLTTKAARLSSQVTRQ